MQVLGGELRGGATGKRRTSCRHFLKDDGQTVLVAMQARSSIKYLRSRILGSHSVDQRRIPLGQVLEQPEIGDLDAPAEQQQVLRFDVKVLQGVVALEVIERCGGFR